MQLYEYVILRYLPRVEREEFFNIGLLMMCKRQHWVRFKFLIDRRKFEAFCPPHSYDELLRQIEAYASIADGNAESTLHDMPVEERFRWLAAVRSTCLQCSRPHPGLTADLDAEFNRIFESTISPCAES